MIESEAVQAPDPARVTVGYALIAQLVGPAIDDAPVPRPLDVMLAQRVGGRALQWHELGHLLHSIRGEPHFADHVCKLQSADRGVVDAKLAELSTLAVLRGRSKPARLGHVARWANRVPDIIFGAGPGWDLEVSRLEFPSTYEEAHQLRALVEQRVWELLHAESRALFVNVTFAGFARELMPRVKAALLEFQTAVAKREAGGPLELVAGFTFEWRPARPPFVHASGATVFGGDPNGAERVGQRLYAKVAEEAEQVGPGGVVVIHTETLACEAFGDDEMAFYVNALSAIESLVNAHPRLAAVGIVEQVVASRMPSAGAGIVRGAPAARPAGNHWQRLIWIASSPRARGGPPTSARRWLAPPYPW